MPDRKPSIDVVIVGAGPAGLTAAYELARRGETSTVLEADSVVGGISRTVERDGWRFDIGGHRFFTKVQAVEDRWHEILPDEDFLLRPRLSRIYTNGTFFDYPLRVVNVLRGLGLVEAARCVLSYAWVRVHPPRKLDTFEEWTASRFGWRLYRTFFKTYTEKVWGVPADQISADWAAQRIKNLSFTKAVANALLPRRNQKDITSLIEEFQYPKYGPGMMWERAREQVEAQGTKVLMQTAVTKLHRDDGGVVAVTAETDGVPTRYPATHVISSMPFSSLLKVMDPEPPEHVLAAAEGLHYRDFLSVALVVAADKVAWADNWIYIHAPEVKTMRVQNFGSWSPYMVREGRNVLGLEYTVTEGDEWWSSGDDELVERGKRELEVLGLMDAGDVEAGYVVRMPKAYPTYDENYRDNVEIMRSWLAENVPNVYPVGRNGMHKYNNQDHSMYTAMLSVENILGANHDIWAVNVEEEYHEERSDGRDSRSEPSSVPGAGKPDGSLRSEGGGRDAPVLPSRSR